MAASDLEELKRPVFEILKHLEEHLDGRMADLERERRELHARREEEHRKREELMTLRGELEAHHAHLLASSYGILSCCYSPVTERSLEIAARKERRQQVQLYATQAFEEADENDDLELTLEELEKIEGENAPFVMKEADVDGNGKLSKREYVNYKIHVAKQVGKAARKAFKSAMNGNHEITLEELYVIEGDNAEKVMREADVDGNGTLSKREYVDYKIRMAAHAGAAASSDH